MRICIPTTGNTGLDEPIHEHFGSAPFFTLVDTADNSIRAIANTNANHRRDHSHQHGDEQSGCSSVDMLVNEKVDTVLAKTVGNGAITKLTQLGIQIIRVPSRTAAEAVQALQAGKLLSVSMSGLNSHRHGEHGGCHH